MTTEPIPTWLVAYLLAAPLAAGVAAGHAIHAWLTLRDLRRTPAEDGA
jgi:hypothetical protein